MLSILLFFLLVSVQNLHGLICYSNGTFYFSRSEFNWNDFSTILTNIENQIISNSSSCHVRITVDYNNQKSNYVSIQFSSYSIYHNTHIEFGSTLNVLENKIQSSVSYLDYSCLSGNLCDKIFLQNWSKQLLNASDNSLHTSFISLWTNSSNLSNICQSEKSINQCTSYLCFSIYDELKNLSYGNSLCKDKLSTNPVHIHIKTYGDYSRDYQCTKNHCTNQVGYNSMLETNYTENFKNNKNENQSNEFIFIRNMIIIGGLVVIGLIAYCIQCRKYRQGYRLTTNA